MSRSTNAKQTAIDRVFNKQSWSKPLNPGLDTSPTSNGLSAQNGGVKRPNVAPSVVDSRFANNSGHGEGKEAARVSASSVRYCQVFFFTHFTHIFNRM